MHQHATNRTTSTQQVRSPSTFSLPELHSPPPMPTFQKSLKHEAIALPTANTTTVPPAADLLPRATKPSAQTLLPRPATPGVTLTENTSPSRPAELFSASPPLPRNWTSEHDQVICILDGRDISLLDIAAKIRRAYPGLKGPVTGRMIDKRLRQLDQDVEIGYWRFEAQVREAEAFAARINGQVGREKEVGGLGVVEEEQEQENERGSKREEMARERDEVPTRGKTRLPLGQVPASAATRATLRQARSTTQMVVV